MVVAMMLVMLDGVGDDDDYVNGGYDDGGEDDDGDGHDDDYDNDEMM